MDVNRRVLSKSSAPVVVAGTLSNLSFGEDDSLPSWNDGPSEKAILDFVCYEWKVFALAAVEKLGGACFRVWVSDFLNDSERLFRCI
jgi:hypothetical protein